MKQRMLIALSLVLDPEVLVMDEPTAALDLLMQRSILSLIHDLKEEYGLTVVFITHDLPLIASLADRLAVLYAFEFIEVGPAQEVKTNAKHPYMRSLLRAVPSIDSPIEDMRPIQGATPDPVNVPAGCSYNPRCPLASEECRMQDPPLEEVAAGHQVSCFHWEDSADEFPLMEGDE
jgi:peptide/nickel transport system ATP-binding protein